MEIRATGNMLPSIIPPDTKFGEWTVYNAVGQRTRQGLVQYLCHCSCGTEKIVPGTTLRTGKSKSCGCSRNVQPPATIGMLTYVCELPKSADQKRRFMYKCSCGREKTCGWSVISHNVRFGARCYCLRTEAVQAKYRDGTFTCPKCHEIKIISDFPIQAKRPERRYDVPRPNLTRCKECLKSKQKADRTTDFQGRLNRVVSAAKSRAKTKNWPFDLSLAWAKEQYVIQSGLCFYSGIEMTSTDGHNSASIDRVNSSGGYTQDNCVLTTCRINWIKNDLSGAEFVEFCKSVAEHSGKIHSSPR